MKQIRRMIRDASACRVYLLALPFAVLTDVICSVLLPAGMADLLREALFQTGQENILVQGLKMAGLSLLLTAVGFLESFCVSKFSAVYTRGLREMLFRKSQKLSLKDTHRFGTASLLTRLSVDMDAVKKAAGMLHSLIRCPLMILCTTVMVLRIDASLSWIFLTVLPLFALVIVLISRSARKHYRNMFVHYDDMNNILQEDVAGIKTVKAFVREKTETEHFIMSAGRVRQETGRAELVTALNSPLLQLAVNTGIMLLLYFGGMNVIHERLQASDLMCLISYTGQILSQVLTISLMLVPFLTAQVSLKRIYDVLNMEPSVSDPGADLALHPENGAVSFQNVSFSYAAEQRDKQVLHDISFTVPSGGFFGVTGVSGSSKTTLVNLIPRFYDCTAGTVLVGGRDVRKYSLSSLRGAIAVVPQSHVLFSGTVAENLRFGRENASDEELAEACMAADAYDFIAAMPDGLNTMLEPGGRNLSGGQRQRLCIARALVRKPKILILDDSLSAVDNLTEARISKALRGYDPGMTVIMISQRLSALRDADNILVLDDGRISAIGRHEALLEENVIYRELFESQRRHME